MATDSVSRELDRIEQEYARRDREVRRDTLQDHYYGQVSEAVKRTIGDLRGRSVLDVGCGDGARLMFFREMGASKLAGIDLRPHACAIAQSNVSEAEVVCGSAHRLPWPDACFDVVSQFVVFTSVLDMELKQQMASEMLRVLKPAGTIFWYDFRFNNPKNASVRGVGQSEVRTLFSGCEVLLTSMILAPPLAASLVPRFARLATILERVPFLRSHYIGTIRRSTKLDASSPTA